MKRILPLQAIKTIGKSGMGLSTSTRALAEYVMSSSRRHAIYGEFILARIPELPIHNEYVLLCANGFPNCLRCPIGDCNIQCMAFRKDNNYTYIKITKNYDW